jgi:hypothetical protein
VIDGSVVAPRYASSRASSCAASSTRPSEVANAGSRVPTSIVIDMILRAGTWAT